MEYISIKEAAKIWGMDPSNIRKLIKKGKIDGAILVARNWLIPKNAPRPVDGRTKRGKEEKKTVPFRFPLLVNCEENAFSPELSEEEKLLRKAELDYYACDFDKAKKAYENILRDTKSIYIKIMVLFYLCSLSVEVYGGHNFKSYYYQLKTAFAGDFPYKKEMEIVIPWLYTVLIQYSSVSASLNFNPFYDYSPTAIPLLSYLSFYHIAEDLQRMTTPVYCDSYELLCRQIEQDGAYYEACESHFALFCAYYLSLNEEAMLYHLRKGMDIAKEYNMPLLPACYLPYYPDAFQKIAKEYPDEYIEKIIQNSKIISQSIADFTEEYNVTKIYSSLSDKDYRYILLALNECTYKQVAGILRISERTVINRYNEIFSKLGVNSKKELLELLYYEFKE